MNITRIPRALLEDVFTIAILAQERGDFKSDDPANAFPSTKLMDIINASDGLKAANVIEIIEPPPPKLVAEVPWEEDSLSKAIDTEPRLPEG